MTCTSISREDLKAKTKENQKISKSGSSLTATRTYLPWNAIREKRPVSLPKSKETIFGAFDQTMKAVAVKCCKMICRKCYERLRPSATNFHSRKYGHSSNLRSKKNY